MANPLPEAAAPDAWRPAWVGIGANLGDAVATVRSAIDALGRLPDCRPGPVSALYRSAPVDADGPDYINAVAGLETRLGALALLAALQRIEADFGRERPYHHAPRSLDLDLLLLGAEQLDTPGLTLPHPRLHRRAFVLRPLLSLSPGLTVPGLGRLADWLPGSADQTLERLKD